MNPDESKPRGMTRVLGSSHIQKLGEDSSKKEDSDSEEDKFGGDIDELKEQAKSPESNNKGGMLKDIKSLNESESDKEEEKDNYDEAPA
jgi:hypothetical protein